MLRSILSIGLLVSVLAVRSQTVFIPDPMFRMILNNWQMDLVDADGYMSLNASTPPVFGLELFWSPIDLTGLEHLPITTLALNFSTPDIQFITPIVLPPGLETYELTGVQALPSEIVIPEGLEHLVVADAPGFTALPTLPSDLPRITLSQLPSLSNLPVLPSGLEYLEVYQTGLTNITVPPSAESSSISILTNPFLETLHIGSSVGQGALDVFHHPSLQEISIGDGFGVTNIIDCEALTMISSLPTGDMGWLELAQLPNLFDLDASFPSSATYLIIDSTSLQCLPPLPDQVQFLELYDNPFTCLPNYPVGHEGLMPLCHIISSRCPDPDPLVRGKVFRDDNENGIQDEFVPRINNAVIISEPANYMVGTDTFGNYMIRLPIGQHTLKISDDWASISDIEPDQYVVDLTALGQEISEYDFGIIPDSNYVDVEVSSIWQQVLRPGFSNTLVILVENHVNEAQNVELELTIDPNLQIQNCTEIPNVQGNILSWPLGSIPFGSDHTIHCVFQVPASMILGTEVITTATVLPMDDAVPSNNVDTKSEIIVGSYDPNDKQVFPSFLTPEEGATGREIEYLIRFQNTGTYLAERVLITDTLSTDLIAQSLEFVASSHPCTWFYREGALHILFEEIMLPDSNSNEPESHGFALFRIDTRDQLLVGDQIDNIANIYFDFNEPVITEPAVLSVVLPTAVEAHATIDAIVHPVPSSGLIEISHDGAWNGAPITIRDLKGNVVMRGNVRDRKEMIDISSLASGIYVIDLVKDGRTWSKRIVKE